MNERRSFLKDLAQRCADAWAGGRAQFAFPGDIRIESRNTIYQLRDGVCIAVTRRERGFRTDPTVFVGMRLVGWLADDDPHAGLISDWRPGAYAVLWRARAADEACSSVALTSATIAAATTRKSVPPPLPAARASALPRPPTPGVATNTLTRVHTPSTSAVLPKPAPPRRTPIAPPPLPRPSHHGPLPRREAPRPRPQSASHVSA